VSSGLVSSPSQTIQRPSIRQRTVPSLLLRYTIRAVTRECGGLQMMVLLMQEDTGDVHKDEDWVVA
jgi:hypothetical protein